jgi:hypothetical protein
MLASAAFTFSSTSFTNSVTSYIVVGTEAGGPSGSCSYIDNLIVKD